MNLVSVDFNKCAGKIKPLHGVCCAPYARSKGSEQTMIDRLFREGNIPYSRLHDCCGAYGGSYYVDIPNIFRDFNADENDPASYDFHYTDEYITAIRKTGCEIYYRLGISIESGSKKYTVAPPKDFEKWTRICEHIIMHYNEGWADGFHYGIKYWEIWNEPDNPGNANGKNMWDGTKEQFFELYKTASIYLKKEFPEILIGGYGSCGFYATTRKVVPEGFPEFVTYFTDFLAMVKENQCPLDFFSWHLYTGDEQELLAHAKYVRETLDSHGFTDTESHLNEWNLHGEGDGFAEKHTMEGASFNAAVLCMLQNTRYLDKAMYYCFSPSSRYNGFLNLNDSGICPPWYSFVAFGRLYSLGNCYETKSDGVYAAAAGNANAQAVLVSNYNSDDSDVSISLKGTFSGKTAHILYITAEKSLTEEFSFKVSDTADMNVRLPKQTVLLIEIK